MIIWYSGLQDAMEQPDCLYLKVYHRMRWAIDLRVETIADWAEEHQMPAVVGEGYVGYTPLSALFEEGPVGKDIAEYAIVACQRRNFWGIILCSNCAPHHPFWQDIAWQQRLNASILHS